MHDEILIRRLDEHDSIRELTALLHRAYAVPAAGGVKFFAADQDDAATRRRAGRGECYVAVDGDSSRLVGTITFVPPWVPDVSRHYGRLDVAWFGQFAVEPTLQRAGLGSQLIALAERRAAETGASEIALDTAEGARDLIAFYQRRGYVRVDAVHWEGAPYRSVVMSKPVPRLERLEARVIARPVADQVAAREPELSR